MPGGRREAAHPVVSEGRERTAPRRRCRVQERSTRDHCPSVCPQESSLESRLVVLLSRREDTTSAIIRGFCRAAPSNEAPMPSKKKSEPGFSRRTFLKTVGAGGVAAGVIAPSGSADAQIAGAVGPGPVPVTLKIKGAGTHTE